MICNSGAAYDTEKEFDSMFATQPYINEYDSDWKYVVYKRLLEIPRLTLTLKSYL